jgi:hypothetical protein
MSKEKRVGQAKIITERDRQILEFVGRNGVAAIGQLHSRYWTNAKERTAQERLQQLVNAGYLLRDSTDTRQPGEIIYGLTRKGAGEFGRLEARRLTVGLPNRGEMKQQLQMQDTYTRLEKDLAGRGAKLVDWRNERELRGEQRREQIRTKGRSAGSRSRLNFEDIADGQAVIEQADGTLTQLDIEADGQYYGQMLKNKLTQLSRSARPTIWVTTGKRRAARIEREIEEAGITNIEVWQIG